AALRAEGQARRARPRQLQAAAAGEEGRAEAPDRRRVEVRPAREPVPVAAVRLLQHAPRQRSEHRRRKAEARARGGGVEECMGMRSRGGQSARAPDSFTIRPSLGMSALTSAARSCGAMPPGSAPRAWMRSTTSGSRSILATSVYSRSTILFGVLAGANRA